MPEAKKTEQSAHNLPANPPPRVGSALDVHAFAQRGTLHLACLDWPEERTLAGHSDGDVAAHAACDALFAAAGIGDLGTNFGTADPAWAGASGASLLAEAARRIRAAGWEIGNISVQVIGNSPRMATRLNEANAAMSTAVDAPVNVSATTTDGLGFTGRGEGLGAHATALLYPRD